MLNKMKFFVMRKTTNKIAKDFVTNFKAKLIGKINIPNDKSLFINDTNKKIHSDNLSNHGFTILDRKLNEGAINEIIEYTKTIKCTDPYRPDLGAIDPLSPPSETHIADFDRKDLTRCNTILKIANDPSLLQVVQEFLGAKPTISNINMWWSFGGRKQAEHAQLFHRDYDDWKFCKLFIYLTDVDEYSGPHIYVKDTSTSPKLRKIRRYSDQEIETTFGKSSILSFKDKKGAAFIVDTFGFHKGLLPESKDRLLLQVQYSLNPILIESYDPISIPDFSFDPAINGLLVKV